jgi:hypothetical protein
VEPKFTGWAIGQRSETSSKVTLKADEATKAVAFYEGEETGEGQKAKPPETTNHLGQRAAGLRAELHPWPAIVVGCL